MGKYLFLTHAGDPGGAEFKMLDCCLGLGTDQTEVLYFQSGSLGEQLSKRGIVGKVLAMPTILSEFKRSQSITGVLKIFPGIFKMLLSLTRTTKNFDVIICMSQKSFFLAAPTRLFTRKPVIWFMNDLVTTESFDKNLILLMSLCAKLFASHIIVNSKASLEAWVNAGGPAHKTSIIHSGIDFQAFDFANQDKLAIANIRTKYRADNKILIGVFGRIARWKGQDVFIKAISKLQNVQALIVGESYFLEDGYKEELIALVEKLNLTESVIFTGHLDNVPTVMAACDIIVHCSRTPEPFGRVIVEALASQKPVIATDGGGAIEIIVNRVTGLLAHCGDEDSLVNMIQAYIDDLAWAKQIASQGYTDAKSRFSTESMVAELKEIVETVMLDTKFPNRH